MLSPQGIRGRMVNLSFRLQQSGRKEEIQKAQSAKLFRKEERGNRTEGSASTDPIPFYFLQ